MELHDPYFITHLAFRESCLLENLVCACLAHLVPNQVHRTLSFKGAHSVGGKGLSHDLDGLVLQCMRMNKIFRNDNTTRSSILRMGRLGKIIQCPIKELTDVGLHMNLVRFFVILGAAKTSSAVHPSRNCE